MSDLLIFCRRFALAGLWLAVAVAAAPAQAGYEQGLQAFDRGDFAVAYEEWWPLAQAGDARAQHGIGLLHETGRGVDKRSDKEAIKWYRAASAQGLPAALSNLALMYAEGRGVAQDLAQAASLWEQAATSGHPMAQFNLGLMYFGGRGVARDHRLAARWFAEAAAQGLADAQYAIGEMYRLGRGVNRDLDEARRWYAMAAQSGYPTAAERLAALGGELPSEIGPSPSPAVLPPVPPAKPEAPAVELETAKLPRPDDETWTGDGNPSSTDPLQSPDLGSDADQPDPAVSAESDPAEGNGAPLADEEADQRAPDSAQPIALASPRPSEEAVRANSGPALSENPKSSIAQPGLPAQPAADGLPGPTPAEVVSDMPADALAAEKPPVPVPPAPEAPARAAQVSSVDMRTAEPQHLAEHESAVSPAQPEPPAAGEEGAVAPIEALAATLAAEEAQSAPLAPTTVVAPTSDKIYRIWLSELDGGGEDDAAADWRRLRENYPDLLGQREPLLRRIQLDDGGVRYRVLAGPFPNRAGAAALCALIRSRDPDQHCMVVLN